MLNPAPHVRAVKQHYERLASQYTVRANRHCQMAFRQRTAMGLHEATRLLEIGCGADPISAGLQIPFQVGVDFSETMLRHRTCHNRLCYVAADAQHLPFVAQTFNGVVSVNVLEHLEKPLQMLRECARLLTSGGLLMVITPNGDLGWMLELAEVFRLKLPEGPHKFVTSKRLRSLIVEAGFHIVSYERFMLFPMGPATFVRLLERVRARLCRGLGLFQCVVATRRSR